jgi:hypothetical protein
MKRVPKLVVLLAALIAMVIGLGLTFGDWHHGWLGRELATSLGTLLIVVVGAIIVFGDQLARW